MRECEIYGWQSVGVAIESFVLAHDGAKLHQGHLCGTCSVLASGIGAEDKDGVIGVSSLFAFKKRMK